ncbi:HEAT repeat domain-containing protein [bacterium]|nr:HEAT repeat domain-containing protein [bacterium]
MCFFALALILAGLYKKLRDKWQPVFAFSGAFGIVLVMIYAGIFAYKRLQIQEHPHEEATAHQENVAQPHGEEEHGFGSGSLKELEIALRDEHSNVRAAAVLKLGESKNPRAFELLLKLLQDPSDAVKENACRSLTQLANPAAIPHLKLALQGKESDPWVKFRLIEALASSGDSEAIGRLVDVIWGKDPRLLRNQALVVLLSLRGQPPNGASLDVENPDGKAAVASITFWWKGKGPMLKFDKDSRSYK